MWEVDETQLSACDFSSWYPAFGRLKTTFPSRIVPLSDEFVEYLQQDGIRLPEGVDIGNECTSSRADEVELKECEDDGNIVPQFTEINSRIRRAMRELGGEVFAKLNWSAPTDAVWMNGGTAKCSRLSEIYLLLKSSDRALFDIGHMRACAKNCSGVRPDSVCLVLRRWVQVATSMEFRCFVFHKRIVAICQRDCTTFYKFLLREKSSVVAQVTAFFHAHIESNFPLDAYVFDVYIDATSRVWLVDFNVFGYPTGALLFDWNELAQSFARADARDVEVDYRVVTSATAVMPSDSGLSRGPIDVAHSKDFSNFINICRDQQNKDTDTEN